MSEDVVDGEIVKHVEQVRGFDIRRWVGDDGTFMYDWVDDSGDESYSLFATIEDAEEDGRRGI